MLLEMILCALLGFTAALAGGFWGLGGGWLIVPTLMLIPTEVPITQGTAAGASIMQMVLTTIRTVSKQFHEFSWQKGGLGREVMVPLGGFIFLGGFLGRYTGDFIEGIFDSRKPHQYFYIVLLFYILYKTLHQAKHHKTHDPQQVHRPFGVVALAGFVSGVISALLGIGGGTINRPVLRGYLGCSEKDTALVARMAVFLTAVSGSVGYAFRNPELEHMLIIAGALAAGGMIGFPLGAAIHKRVVIAGFERLAHGSFALVVGIVLVSQISKAAGVLLLGQCLLLVACVIMLVFFATVNVKAGKVIKDSSSK